MNDLADEALLELVREGDERAFEALVLRYGRPLRSYCTRLGVPAHSTEDVIQQTLLEAWIALRAGAQVHAFKAWLYRIAHNIALDAIAKTPRVVELACAEAQSAMQTPAEMPGSGLQETLSAVASLPPMQREAIVRTALAGESHEQVGRYLGLTAGAVRGLVYRGRVTLRSALAALVPPWLPRLLASRSSASGSLRESLPGIAAGAGSTSSAGALVKAGVMVAVAATAITATLPGHAARTRTDRPVPHAPASGAAGADLAPGGGGTQRSANRSVRAAVSSSAGRPAKARGGSAPSNSTGARGRGSQLAVSRPSTSSIGAGQAQPQASQPAAGGTADASAQTSSTPTASSQPSQPASSSPLAEAASGSGTQPTGGSGSTGGEQAPPSSGSSGSSSSDGGGLVGEVVHTVEKTLETTLEDTLGGLLRH